MKDFGGTVIFVSHDRGFIEDLSTKVLELHPGLSREFPGDYKYYMQRLEDEANGLAGGSSSQVQSETARIQPKSETKLSWEEQKKQDAEKRKLVKEVERLEKEILDAEEKKESLEAEMGRPEVYSNGEKAKSVQKKIDEICLLLDELNARWEEAAEKIQ